MSISPISNFTSTANVNLSNSFKTDASDTQKSLETSSKPQGVSSSSKESASTINRTNDPNDSSDVAKQDLAAINNQVVKSGKNTTSPAGTLLNVLA